MEMKEQNLTDKEKEIVTIKISYEIERQLESSLSSTAQYIKNTFINGLINEKRD